MSLNETDRKEIVKYRLEKARNTLAEVPVLMGNKFYTTALNRLYYSCYYAASALLIRDGHETHTHNGVKTLLSLYYIKENRLDVSFGNMYGKLFSMRITGDYEDWVKIEEEDVKPFIEPAQKFITAIENLISNVISINKCNIK